MACRTNGLARTVLYGKPRPILQKGGDRPPSYSIALLREGNVLAVYTHAETSAGSQYGGLLVRMKAATTGAKLVTQAGS